jgi:NADPH:quinone reductase-like Zn-dependent oxidoreductase
VFGGVCSYLVSGNDSLMNLSANSPGKAMKDKTSDISKVIEIYSTQRGGTRLAERGLSALQPDEVRIKMEAFSLNHRDLVVTRSGKSPNEMALPRIPLSDGVGVVIAVGHAVKSLRIGDRVASTFWPEWQGGRFDARKGTSGIGGSAHDGVLREYWQTAARAVVKVPDYLSAIEAATLPCAALTAWTSLKRAEAGQRVLIHGSGTVALFAAQFAKAKGLHTTITTRSLHKRAQLESLGAIVYCYEGEDWLTGVGRESFDVVVDPVGGRTFADSLSALTTGGHIVTLGHVGGGKCEIDSNEIWGGGLTIYPAMVGSIDDFNEMNRALDAWRLKPIIANVRPWFELEQALDQLARANHMGKLVLTV